MGWPDGDACSDVGETMTSPDGAADFRGVIPVGDRTKLDRVPNLNGKLYALTRCATQA